ncbi:hypothetical protein MAR_002095 [Mya arenaria]|uniref:Uncharacterized protein n=1 Tax=Mya arenaria TaxID=6604 RepID=A0ABY7FDR6_MYAAR|nr:hypothetical protein MAR_002095 [Mya arenaria]
MYVKRIFYFIKTGTNNRHRYLIYPVSAPMSKQLVYISSRRKRKFTDIGGNKLGSRPTTLQICAILAINLIQNYQRSNVFYEGFVRKRAIALANKHHFAKKE